MSLVHLMIENAFFLKVFFERTGGSEVSNFFTFSHHATKIIILMGFYPKDQQKVFHRRKVDGNIQFTKCILKKFYMVCIAVHPIFTLIPLNKIQSNQLPSEVT